MSQTFLLHNKNKIKPIIIGLASGLYPLLYNYYSNFTLVDSKSQLLFFITIFLGIPILINVLLKVSAHYNSSIKRHVDQAISCVNLSWFMGLIIISAFGFQKKMIVVAISIAIIFGLLVYKHLMKIVAFQLLMAMITGLMLLIYCIKDVDFSTIWQELPDTITEANFVTTPNIYIIQPDGYANPSVLKKAPYTIDNSVFEGFLTTKGFKIYSDFRSNYTNTITSNSAMFAMKHHYYKNPTPNTKEPEGLRRSIAGNNAVLKTLKHNNYNTSLLLEVPYLVINRPEIAYDYCSIKYAKLPFLSRGFDTSINLLEETKDAIINNKNKVNFYFIEKMLPKHIAVQASQSKGKEAEREDYIKNIKAVNYWLSSMVDLITESDPEALIVIVADHGGFVGMDYTAQRRKKITNPAIIHSIFSSLLAIKWPNNSPPKFETALKTNTNLFRILFAYLSQDEVYLEQLEDDGSYIIVNKDVPHDVYRVIDDNGAVEFSPQ